MFVQRSHCVQAGLLFWRWQWPRVACVELVKQRAVKHLVALLVFGFGKLIWSSISLNYIIIKEGH